MNLDLAGACAIVIAAPSVALAFWRLRMRAARRVAWVVLGASVVVSLTALVAYQLQLVPVAVLFVGATIPVAISVFANRVVRATGGPRSEDCAVAVLGVVVDELRIPYGSGPEGVFHQRPIDAAKWVAELERRRTPETDAAIDATIAFLHQWPPTGDPSADRALWQAGLAASNISAPLFRRAFQSGARPRVVAEVLGFERTDAWPPGLPELGAREAAALAGAAVAAVGIAFLVGRAVRITLTSAALLATPDTPAQPARLMLTGLFIAVALAAFVPLLRRIVPAIDRISILEAAVLGVVAPVALGDQIATTASGIAAQLLGSSSVEAEAVVRILISAALTATVTFLTLSVIVHAEDRRMENSATSVE